MYGILNLYLLEPHYFGEVFFAGKLKISNGKIKMGLIKIVCCILYIGTPLYQDYYELYLLDEIMSI